MTQRYLYAAKRRKCVNAGPATMTSTSEKSSHNCCFWASARREPRDDGQSERREHDGERR